MPARRKTTLPSLLPGPFAAWFDKRGWAPRPHQLELLQKARAGRSALLIAPTGAGKTLAGFLPSLVSIAARPKRPLAGGRGIHTLYISPLKALAVDIARNLTTPVVEIGLGVRIETRTGDTSLHKRRRQRLDPPDILLTTPEQVALLLSAPDADRFFADLDTVICDELHALVTNKRGDLLSLGLARLRSIAPNLKTIGLSATVSDPDELRGWLMGQVPAAIGAAAALPPHKAIDGKGSASAADSQGRLLTRETAEGDHAQHGEGGGGCVSVALHRFAVPLCRLRGRGTGVTGPNSRPLASPI